MFRWFWFQLRRRKTKSQKKIWLSNSERKREKTEKREGKGEREREGKRIICFDKSWIHCWMMHSWRHTVHISSVNLSFRFLSPRKMNLLFSFSLFPSPLRSFSLFFFFFSANIPKMKYIYAPYVLWTMSDVQTAFLSFSFPWFFLFLLLFSTTADLIATLPSFSLSLSLSLSLRFSTEKKKHL